MARAYSEVLMSRPRWLHLLRGLARPAPPASPDPRVEPDAAPSLRLDPLELQTAMIQHLEWCVQFNEFLCQIRPGEPPLVRTLPGPDDSEMGRWLRAVAGRAPGQHPLFAALQQAHRHFHALAEEAILLAEEDRMDLASTLLNTDFERARGQVVRLLREMQRG